MNIKYISVATIAMALSASSFAAPPNDNRANPNRMAQQPPGDYWQAPNWPNVNAATAHDLAPSGYYVQPPARNNDYRPPAYPGTPNYYGQAYPSNNYPAQNDYQPGLNQSGWDRGAPPQPGHDAYRGNPYPAQRGPYPGADRYQYYPDNDQPAYNHPGYGPDDHNNAWNNTPPDDPFWGNSEPNPWANPNQGNTGQRWNNMTNGPAGMGDMSGGWRAPHFSTPNPVDMGDQLQDNVGNLPGQLRDRRR